jgi:hypothetical protein
MKKLKLFSTTLFLVFFFSQLYFGQSDTTKVIHVVKKHNGSEYIGVILSDDGREVLIETEKLGKVYIPKSEIKEIKLVTNDKDITYGEFNEAGPFTTRYAFTTNALPVVKGENYALINLYGPEVHFAVTNHLNVGIMSTWIGSPLALALKYTIPTKKEKLNFSIGSVTGTSGYLNNFRGFGGLHFANVTLGDRKSNLTFAGGFAHVQTGMEQGILTPGVYRTNEMYYYPSEVEDWYNSKSPAILGPMFSIAGITKIGPRASLVFDSMLGIFNFRNTRNEVQTATLKEPVYDPVFEPGVYEHTVTHVTEIRQTIAFFLMPGMRFQKDDKKAFQFSLAGVSVFQQSNTISENYSFPMPMCTWFFKF